MRILVASDLHYRLPHYDWLVDQAADFDVIALPGDHIDIAATVPIDAQIVVLSAYFERLAERSTVLVTSGNHDLDGPGAHGEQMAGWIQRKGSDLLHVDGTSVDVGSTRFTLCPWWDGPITRAEVDTQLAVAGEGRPERWVWLYHSPPGGTGLCRTATREFPDHDLNGWIEQWAPDLVFTGHVHQAPWVSGGSWVGKVGDSWVFNAGRTSGPTPAHIVVDTEAATAEWVALPDRAGVELGR